MRRPKYQLMLLAALVLILYSITLTQLSNLVLKLLPTAARCNQQAVSDPQVLALINALRDANIYSAQLSIRRAQGQVQHCTFGWSLNWLLPYKVNEQHIFRYASLSKLLTALSAIKNQQNSSYLDSSLASVVRLADTPRDERIKAITLAHLLSHRAGFDRAITGDVMLTAKPWCPAQLQQLSEVSLDFAPGTQFAYSNLGYCLAGAMLAREQLLARVIHDTLALDKYPSIQQVPNKKWLDDEIRYQFQPPDNRQQLLNLDYEAMLASGGWAGNAKDLLNLLSDVFFAERPSTASISYFDAYLDKQCDPAFWRKCHSLTFYKYQPQNQPAIYWRDGSLPGLTSFAAVSENGDIVVLLANTREYNWLPFNDHLGQLIYNYISKS